MSQPEHFAAVVGRLLPQLVCPACTGPMRHASIAGTDSKIHPACEAELAKPRRSRRR